jgi:hypothetical protein
LATKIATERKYIVLCPVRCPPRMCAGADGAGCGSQTAGCKKRVGEAAVARLAEPTHAQQHADWKRMVRTHTDGSTLPPF